MPRGIAEFHPREVKHLMHEDPRELGAGAMKRNAPFADKRSGVQRGVIGRARDSQWRAGSDREPAQQYAHLPSEPGIVSYEQISG